MKKNESNKLSALLEQLQAAMTPSAKKEKKPTKPKRGTQADRELEEQLRQMLNEVSPSEKEPSAPKRKAETPKKKEDGHAREMLTSSQKSEKPKKQESPKKAEAVEKTEVATERKPQAPDPIEEQLLQVMRSVEPTTVPAKKEPRQKKTAQKKKNEPVTVEEPIEEVAPVVEDETKEEVASVVENETEEVTPVVEDESEEVASVVEDETEEEVTPVVEDETEEEVAPVVENETEEVASVIEDESEEIAPVVENETEEVVPVVENETEEVASVVADEAEQVIPVVEDIPAAVEKASPKKTLRIPLPIRIRPKSTSVTVSELPNKAQKTREQEPIVIRPPMDTRPTIEQKKRDDTIVIRPSKSAKGERSPIVIEPRREEPTPPPNPVEPRTVSQEPIRIGKKVDHNMNNNTQTPNKNQEPAVTSPPEREPDVTMVPNDSPFVKQKTAAPTQNGTQEQTREETEKISEPTVNTKKMSKGSVYDFKSVPEESETAQEEAPSASQDSAKKTPKASPAHKKSLLSSSPLSAKTASEALRIKKKTPQATPKKSAPVDANLDEMADQAVERDPSSSALGGTSEPTQEQLDIDALYAELKKDHGLSVNDIDMIFELEYEHELERLIGHQKLKKLRGDYVRRAVKNRPLSENGPCGATDKNPRRSGTAFAYRGEEYLCEEERGTFYMQYHADRFRLTIRTAITAFVTVLLLFIDAPFIIGPVLMNAFVAYPWIAPLSGLLLLGACVVTSYRSFCAGMKQLLLFRPTPYSVCAILTPFAIAYGILSFFLPMPSLYSVTAFAFLVTLICDILRINSEMRSFALIASPHEKTVLEKMAPLKKKLNLKNRTVKVINDDVDTQFYRIRTAREAVGFFRRCNSMRAAARPFMAMILVMLALSLGIGIFYGVKTLSFTTAASAFMTVLAASTPVSAIFSYFYPLFIANFLLMRRGCAIVGDEGVEEYDREKTLIFRDTDIVTAKKRAEKGIHADYDFSRDLRLADTLLRKMGGTLAQAAKYKRTIGADVPVTVTRITEGGIEAVAEQKYHLLAGTAAFMRRHKIEVPKESADEQLSRTPNVVLLYVAIDRLLKVCYEIEYTLHPAFEEKSEQLAECETSVGIRTYDPNLTEDLICAIRGEGEHTAYRPVRVFHSPHYEDDSPIQVVDTGAVAVSAPESILSVVYAASSVGVTRRFGMRMQTIATLIGGIGTLLLALLTPSGFLGALPILGYQLLWIVVSLIATHSELNPLTLYLKK